ncbi:MAG: fused MFS/spermidine synthase [Verrucomicrobia bacterium]|nr:fused MFS/spermidine synthase [Verrucomicrobiota bacterium]
MTSHAGRVHALILGSFFVSGVAGLLYQVVWTRYLALFLGHTSYAVVAVLAAFMGGLALGNAWLGSVADRVRQPLLMYAGLELGIGAFALVFPYYFQGIQGAFVGLVRATEPAGTVRLGIQFVFAALAILLPTVLMGATLPALTRYVTRSLGELRGRVAGLYAINSTGAVAGTIWSDWWLIPGVGLELTLRIGATLSIVVGLVAWLICRATDDGDAADVPRPRDPGTPEGEVFTPAQLRLALWGIGISGFVAMVYEVAWTRLLALSLGSSTHAYSLMLATFISGIAAGSAWVARWKRPGATLEAFGWAELALAGTLFVSVWFYDLLPWWFVELSEVLSRNAGAFTLYELFQALICVGVMFVPAACLGATLPLASRVATSALSATGRSVGRVFAVNTLGTVLGAVAGGLVLLPNLGLARTFALGIALNALVGMAVLAARWKRPALVWGVPAAVLVVAWLGASQVQTRWQKAFALGIWRAGISRPTAADYRAMVDSTDLRYYRDGAGSSVAVIANTLPSGVEQLSLRVNGKTDATSVGDMSTQVLMAHLPLLLRPQSTNALVVGLGSGVTAASLLQHPGMERVEVVEISPEVVEVAGLLFTNVNHDVLRNPRMHLAIEDAKSHLQTTPRRYDVIVTEPSNPWMAGVAGVFSQEYYQHLRSRLNPGGVVAQWLQLYESNDRIADIVINTFASVFPSVGIWHVGPGDIVLLGAVDPPVADLQAMQRMVEEPAVRADLERVGFRSLASLLQLELIPQGDGAQVPEAFPDTPIHTDLHPVLEYAAQEAFFERAGSEKVFSLAETRVPRPRMLLSRLRPLAALDADDFRRSADLYRVSSLPDSTILRSQVRRWLDLAPGSFEALEWLSGLDRNVPSPEAPAAMLASRPDFAAALEKHSVPLMRTQALALLTVHRARRSAFYLPDSTLLETLLRSLIEHDPDRRRLHRANLAEVVWDRGDDARFQELSARVFAPVTPEDGPIDFVADPVAPSAVILRMLLTQERRGELKAAVETIRQAVERGIVGQGARVQNPVAEYHVRRILEVALANPAVSGLNASAP